MEDLNALMQQRMALSQRIEELQRQGRQEAMAQIKQMAAQFSITSVELARLGGTAFRGGAKPAAAPAVAKYRDQESGQTWVGRGKRPEWLNAKLAKGASLEDFLIGATPKAPAKKTPAGKRAVVRSKKK